MKINTKIALTILPLISIPLLLVGVYSYITLWQVSTLQSKSQVEAYLKLLNEDYQSKVHAAHLTLQSITNGPLLNRYLLINSQEDRYSLMYRPMLARLKSMQQANPNLYEIRLLLPNGFEEMRVVNRALANKEDNEANSRFFQYAKLSEETITEYIGINPDTGKFALFITASIKIRDRNRTNIDSRPKLYGYLSITQDIDKQVESRLPSPLEEGYLLLQNTILNQQISNSLIGKQAFKKEQLSQLSELPVGVWSDIQFGGENTQHIAYPLSSGIRLHALLPERLLLMSSHQVSRFSLLLALIAISVSVPLLYYVLKVQILTRIAGLHNAIQSINKERKLISLEDDNKDEVGDLIKAFNDMSLELFNSNERIKSLAYHDTLTALPNRFMFHKNLGRATEQAVRDRTMLALFYLDLDNFKYVNDNMGHPVGDILLQKTARRLQECLRTEDMMYRLNPADPSDNLSRLGGDEFAIMIPRLQKPYHARSIAKRILKALTEPFIIEGHVIYVGVSIGIALWPTDTDNNEQLIAFADQAMYKAKNNGKNCYKYFSPRIGQETKERALLEQRIYLAIEQQDFVLNYQAVVSTDDLKVKSYEALIRWYDSELGIIPPSKFIPIAEENGSIIKIGEWVVSEVCRQINLWKKAGYKEVKVGINLSAQQVNNTLAVDQILSILKKKKIGPKHVYFELTESSVMQGTKTAIKSIERLCEHGYEIALDDFGTGYSSLSYLQSLPIDILKIDRSFICNLQEQDANPKILRAIIDVARALGLRIIAEGIEEAEQLDYLPKDSTVFAQGYLFSKPCDADAAIELLKRSKQVGQLNFK